MTKELAARVAEWRDALSRSGWLAREALASKCVTDLAEFLDEVERLDAERDQALAVAQAVGSQMTDLARQLGELQGKASIMEHVHLLDDWREKCEAQAVQNDALQQENVTLGICCDKAVKERDEARDTLAEKREAYEAVRTKGTTMIADLTVSLTNARRQRDAALAREAMLREALKKIEVWVGEFPPSGRWWTDGREMSYSAAFGSNGERDFMRDTARAALKTEG